MLRKNDQGELSEWNQHKLPPASACTCQPLPGPPYKSRSAMADECYVATFTKHPVTYAVPAQLANAHWGSASAVADLGSVQIAFLGVFARCGPWLISNDAQRRRWSTPTKAVSEQVKAYSGALNGKTFKGKWVCFAFIVMTWEARQVAIWCFCWVLPPVPGLLTQTLPFFLFKVIRGVDRRWICIMNNTERWCIQILLL